MRKVMVLLLALPFIAQAQSMGIKDIPAGENTTIEIKKGKSDREFEVVSGEDDIEGEAAPLLKEARANWKTACADWKKETIELNKEKESQVLSLSCGSMQCSTVSMESTCRSKAKYRLKVRVK